MHGLRSKILLLTLLPVVATLFLIGGLAIYNKNQTERLLLKNYLTSYQELLENGALNLETTEDKTKLESLLNEKVEFAEILRRDYSVIYTSENSAAPLIDESEKVQIDQAFNGVETTKNIQKNGKLGFAIISPLVINGKIVAVLHVALSYERTNERIIQYAFFILFLMITGLALCYSVISISLDQLVLKNIYSLKQSTIEMQKGNLSTPVVIQSNDEIGDFASTLDAMRAEVKTSRSRLEKSNVQLGQTVTERTEEVNQKLAELERMNKLMVGRELKMAELKKVVQELKQKLDEYANNESQSAKK